MINLPVSAISFFIYRMDIDYLENGLDEDGIYAGLSYEAFVKTLREHFQKYKAAGIDRLTYILGEIDGVDNFCMGFEAETLKEILPFVLEIDKEQNVRAIHPINHFRKTAYSRSNLGL